MQTITQLKEEVKKLRKDRNMYKKAFLELVCYFDSISDEEQPKVSKKLDKIFKDKLK